VVSTFLFNEQFYYNILFLICQSAD
jgi:hypothetical protein